MPSLWCVRALGTRCRISGWIEFSICLAYATGTSTRLTFAPVPPNRTLTVVRPWSFVVRDSYGPTTNDRRPTTSVMQLRHELLLGLYRVPQQESHSCYGRCVRVPRTDSKFLLPCFLEPQNHNPSPHLYS